MTIENPEVIDAIGTDTVTGEVVLMISDGLNWSNEHHHLSLLQDKINAYFGVVGQLREAHPEAKKHGMRIDCICSHPAPESTAWFAEEVRKVAAPLGVGFEFKTIPQDMLAQQATE